MAHESSTTAAEGVAHQAELRRVMGPKLLLLFIIGDILGTGIYAMTGNVARQVGGVVWLPFLIAFIVATLTAFSYLELVTKYPQAAGAALYTHKAFGVHFVTFLVAFAVMCSGITSASTASRAFAANFGAMISVVREDWMGGAPLRAERHLDNRPGGHFHLPDRRHQFAGSRRERQDERGADLCRAHRPADRDLRRLLRDGAG